jgi:hypothetical protein
MAARALLVWRIEFKDVNNMISSKIKKPRKLSAPKALETKKPRATLSAHGFWILFSWLSR